jgi:glucose-6-phosphate 1-epimerase
MSTSEFDALNRQHALPGKLAFGPGPGGLAVAVVNNSHASAMIALQGAHVMTWTPHGQQPVIWLSRAATFSPGKSIRGGVPICWPWFGPHASDAKLPGHGFARTVPWEVVESRSLRDDRTVLVLRLTETEATRKQWPHATPVEAHITVGTTLEMELVTHNNGSAPVTIGDALHTYLEVSDIREVKIHGLGGCPYLDKVDGGSRKQQQGPVTVGSEVDRVYLESTADCLVEDPRWRRRIRVSKRGSRSSVVWNPWTEKAAKMGDFGTRGYLNMVCVESTNAAEDVVNIGPGGEHRLWVRYAVEPIS